MDTTSETVVTRKNYELRTRGITLDAGVCALLADNVSVGLAARNLVEVDGWAASRRVEAGVGVFLDSLHAEVAWFGDVMEDRAVESAFALGLEYVLESAPVRLGYRYEQVGDNYVTSGVGFRSETFGGDVAYEQNVSENSDRRVGASFSAYF